jgi:sarcosine oxidase, subunit beta
MTSATNDYFPASTHSDLPATADVVVIGAGVNGLATAFELKRRGAGSVVILERKHVGAGATGKSGALIRQHYTNVPEALLTLHSMETFTNWNDAVGHGDPRFEQPGFLRVVAPEDERKLRANVQNLRDAGINTWIVTPDEIAEIEPLLFTGDIAAAAFEPDAGYADPNATMYGYAEAATANGAMLMLDCEATRIDVRADRVVAVETSRGRIETPQVLVAAGPWADRLLDPVGLTIGLTPYKSQVVIFRWPMIMPQNRKHRVVIDTVNKSWLRPEGDAGTLIGIEFKDRTGNPDTFPQFPPIEYIDQARDALAARFPVFTGATMRGGWTGMYMMSPDHHPIIGKMDQIEGLFVMTGDSGSSFKTAPATGICLAELMTDGKSSLVDLTPFRPSRFAEGKLWVDEHSYGTAEEALSISR